MTHTPGPWVLIHGYYTDDPHAIRASGKNIVNSGGISRAASGEGKANARLIAAAPDLLEALEAMVVAEVDYMTINNLGDPEQQHNVKLSLAAIAKAKGSKT